MRTERYIPVDFFLFKVSSQEFLICFVLFLFKIVEFCRLKTKRSGDEWRKSEFKCAFKVVET